MNIHIAQAIHVHRQWYCVIARACNFRFQRKSDIDQSPRSE